MFFSERFLLSYAVSPTMKAFLCAFLLLTLVRPSGSGAENTEEKVVGTRVADVDRAAPGVVSWSPDGKKLAFLHKGLHIYHTETRQRSTLEVENPFYVVWNNNDTILTLSMENEKKRLSLSDPEKLSTRKIDLDIEPQAVFPAGDGKNVLLVTFTAKRFSIGTDLQYAIFLHNLESGKAREVYRVGRVFPARSVDLHFVNAWLHAGLNPLDKSLAVMEHIKPPVGVLYTRTRGLDYMTGETRTITDHGRRKMSFSGSWSPDGRRIALTGGEGSIEIITLSTGATVSCENIDALYPSWNPQGSRIFAGGLLIDADCENRERLLPECAEGIAQWSPDGTALAVVSQASLWFFPNIQPSFKAPDRPLDNSLAKKILLLKEVLGDGFIDEREYRERYDKLFYKKD